MKITKRRKLIISSALVAMVAITAGFEITSRQVMKPVTETGDINEMENISIVTEKNVTGSTRFSKFGKNGNSIDYGNIFLTTNVLNSNIGLKKYIEISNKLEYEPYTIDVGEKTYFLTHKIKGENKTSFNILEYDKKSKSENSIEIPLKVEDNSTISSLNDFIERDGKLYALVVSNNDYTSVIELDLKNKSYKIKDTLDKYPDLVPNFFVQKWDPSHKYIYIALRNNNMQEGDTLDNYLARYDFKSGKFLKPTPLVGIEGIKGFSYTDNTLLLENEENEFIAYAANNTDKHLYKFTYDLNSMKLKNTEKLSLEVNNILDDEIFNNEFVGGTSDDSKIIIKDGKIYYMSALKINFNGDAGESRASMNLDGESSAILKVFNVEKNKIVYEAVFKPQDIETPMFIVE